MVRCQGVRIFGLNTILFFRYYNFNEVQMFTFSRRIDEGGSDITVSNGTVKPVLSNHSKIDKTKVLMTNGSLMKVKSIAECSSWSILQYF